MSIRYKSDLDWFQLVYLKTDVEQCAWQLVGVTLTPNGPTFTISKAGEYIDVYEDEFSIDVNTELKFGLENNFD
jgi:hypothetical protein